MTNNPLDQLDQFTGTTQYHHWSNIFPRHFVLTDGAKFLAEQAGAYWLMDLIASYQPKIQPKNPFQVWQLTVSHNTAQAVCTDGNNKRIAAQNIEYTEFPLSEIKLYAIYDGTWFVIMLPSEY